MGLLSRITTLTNANLNALLDKAEDPEKMLREFLRQTDDCKTEIYEAIVEAQAEVLILKREYGDKPSDEFKGMLEHQGKLVARLRSSAEQLDKRIAEAEGKAVSLIARHKVAKASIRTQRLLRGIGVRFGALKGFEAMRQKIEQEEAIAEVLTELGE